jgi:hypothetical protein
MCFTGIETAAAIAGLASAAVGTYGAVQSSNAQSKAAQAVADQNRVTTTAQNRAFQDRLLAQSQQGDNTFGAQVQGLQDRSLAAGQMRAGQESALAQQKAVLDAENAQAERIRAAGDEQAGTLLDQTSGRTLAQNQADAAARQAALADQPIAAISPDATDPNAGSSGSQDAYRRRMAQAATNIRSYGQKIADVGSYGQPVADVSNAIQGNKVGIMPGQVASQLLASGASTRLLPSRMAYQEATGLGGSADQIIQSRTQGLVDQASLQASNKIGLANLAQGDTNTIAANKAAQAKADADYQKSVGGIISGIGNLGMYGAGRFSQSTTPPVNADQFARLTSGIA